MLLSMIGQIYWCITTELYSKKAIQILAFTKHSTSQNDDFTVQALFWEHYIRGNVKLWEKYDLIQSPFSFCRNTKSKSTQCPFPSSASAGLSSWAFLSKDRVEKGV